MSTPNLSKRAIDRAVIGNTAQHPVAIYPTVVGVLGGIGAALFGPSLLTVGALVGGLSLGVGGWAFQYFAKGDDHAKKLVETIQRQLEARLRTVREDLDRDLAEVGDQRGQAQLRSFVEKFENFRTILGRQLNPGEITYQRYLAMAEQVMLAGLDNLKSICLSLRSANAIDAETLRERLSRDRSLADDERRSLESRLSLYEDQMRGINSRYAQNEEALTQLDHVSARIASIQTGSGHAHMDIEAAMSELRILAERAERYETPTA
ncbi:MAG: hypothetical protein AAF493_09465 [Pseudomonadota bacterium]